MLSLPEEPLSEMPNPGRGLTGTDGTAFHHRVTPPKAKISAQNSDRTKVIKVGDTKTASRKNWQ